MDALHSITLALAASWAGGINLYATIAVLGFLNLLGIVDLPADLQVLGSFWVLGAAVFLYVVEFFADKIPGIDSLWDMLQTFFRIPGGALLAAGAMAGLDSGAGPEVETTLALLLGGAVSAGSHATKAAGRAMINTSPEPFTNWFASLAEDILAVAAILAALFNPVLFLIGLGLFVLLAVWLLPKLWRGLRRFGAAFRHPLEAVRAGRGKGNEE